MSFTYKESMDNAPENAVFTDTSQSAISYDSLGRKYRDYINSASGNVLTSTYSYVDHATVANRTSGLVSKIDYSLSSLDDLEYTYDSRGNITSVTVGGITDRYTYDSLNRLVQTDSLNQGRTFVYEYDASGNIISKKEYAYKNTSGTPIDTIVYTYGSADWKDKLTKYDGKAIDYDEIGNPLTYDGKTFTWVGRRLNTYTSGSITTSYKYNADGIRTSKTVDSTTTEYFLNGSQILAQKTGSTIIPFYYDANGTRIAFKYNGTMYYYVYNLQGDVTHIIDASKNIVDIYQYDAWGRILNLGALSEVGNANPFRYRGYYYDNESGLYYLNSRYYNAEWGRFINADSAISGVGGDIRGYNLFANCMNNPVNMTDEAGNWPKWLENTIKAVSVVAVVATAAVVVGVATVGTGGFALAAAGVAFGAACGGLVGGISNEKKGESFINGWIGGGVGGLVQSVGTATLNYVGTIVGGGVGSGIGTAITEKLNNRGKSEKYQKSSKEIFNESLQAAAIGTIMSTLTAGIDYGIDYAQGSFGYNSWADSLVPGVGIAPITPGFSIMMSGFFGSVDDALANIFCE